MKKIYTSIFALAMIATAQLTSAQTVSVTLSVDMTNYLNAGSVIDPTGMHVAGNFTLPNAWTPADNALTQVPTTNTYGKTFSVDASLSPTMEFKFLSRDNWGNCHENQECLAGACTNGTNDNRFIDLAAAPASIIYYTSWDSCTGTEIFNSTNDITKYVSNVTVSPNPSANVFNIAIITGVTAEFNVKVYDILGKEVSVIADGLSLNKGNYNVSWDGNNSAGTKANPGTYFVRISVGNASYVKQVQLM
jgi:hypothetical protein